MKTGDLRGSVSHQVAVNIAFNDDRIHCSRDCRWLTSRGNASMAYPMYWVCTLYHKELKWDHDRKYNCDWPKRCDMCLGETGE